MKKFPLIIVSIIAISSMFYACNLRNALDQVNKRGYICSNYSQMPVNQMQKQEVLDMIKNYYNNQYAAIHSTNNSTNAPLVSFTQQSINTSKDSRCVFFSIDTLKRLLYYVEKASEKFSTQDKANLGLNIYFASYPKSQGVVINGDDYTNRHTLVMLPSIFNPSLKMAKDLNLCTNLSSPSSTPSFINAEFVNNPTNVFLCGALGFSLKSSNTGNGMMSQNHGSGTPPPVDQNGNTGNPILDATNPN